MSDGSVGGGAAVQSSFIQQAQLDPVGGANSLEDMLEKYGPEGVANAASQQFLNEFFDDLKSMINDSDLPQSTKDMLTALINSHQAQLNTSMPAAPEARADVADSGMGQGVSETRAATTQDVSATADAAPADQTSTEAQAEAEAEAASEGSSGEYDQGAMDAINSELADPSKSSKKGRNWLEALALALAEIQAEFINRAMEASEIMASETDKMNAGEGGGEGKNTGSKTGEGGPTSGNSGAFFRAQAQYTSNIQLFTIFSNQVSTSIKSVGEGMAGISRKQ